MSKVNRRSVTSKLFIAAGVCFVLVAGILTALSPADPGVNLVFGAVGLAMFAVAALV